MLKSKKKKNNIDKKIGHKLNLDYTNLDKDNINKLINKLAKLYNSNNNQENELHEYYYERLTNQKQKLQEKINREKRIIKQQKYAQQSKARKARTRRLIQKGALLEKYFDIDNLSVDETE